MNYQRIKLTYNLESLEPVFSWKTMDLHYNRLHKNYETKLNQALQGTEWEKRYPILKDLMSNLHVIPKEIREVIRFFGGGLINHNFFFSILAPKDTKKIVSENLQEFINQEFSKTSTEEEPIDNLKSQLVESALQIRGSGWTWLIINQEGKAEVINTVNQDNPWSLHLYPLVGLDIWEHAYWLDYYEDRKNYVKNIVNHLLNWEKISELYLKYVIS